MEFTLTFVRLFFWSLYLLWPLLVFLLLLVIGLGQVVARVESWTKFDGFYWALITALTVGYGDIRPLRKRSKSLSILIALVGMMFTGIVISVTLSATNMAFEKHGNQQVIEKMKERFEQP